MAGYASGTSVPSDRTRVEIERTLQRFGATSFAYGWEDDIAAIGFKIAGRMVRMQLPLPDMNDPTIRMTPAGRNRTETQVKEAWAAEERRRWRSLSLIVKAKLTAVADGISTIEREFMADVVIPDGRTVGEWLQPQIEKAYDRGTMPALMPGTGRGE
jgi:hypothetical protein